LERLLEGLDEQRRGGLDVDISRTSPSRIVQQTSRGRLRLRRTFLISSPGVDPRHQLPALPGVQRSREA
jgi:hypothetical protein